MPETNMCVCLGYPEVVTRITLYKAVGLERVKATGGADPFCVVMCEGQKSYSDCSKGTLDPVWGDSFVFYRKSPMKEPIVVEVRVVGGPSLPKVFWLRWFLRDS